MLALNVGSSSLKFGLFVVGPSGSPMVLSGMEEAAGDPQAALAGIAQRLDAQGLAAPALALHEVLLRHRTSGAESRGLPGMDRP